MTSDLWSSHAPPWDLNPGLYIASTLAADHVPSSRDYTSNASSVDEQSCAPPLLLGRGTCCGGAPFCLSTLWDRFSVTPESYCLQNNPVSGGLGGWAPMVSEDPLPQLASSAITRAPYPLPCMGIWVAPGCASRKHHPLVP